MLLDNAVMLFLYQRGDISMKNENETKAKLLVSAKQEFLEKGYMQASLRSICKNAGVTTGALYFFFHDKEDLFAALVEEPLEKMYQLMREHFEDEINYITQISAELTSKEDFSEDLEVAQSVIHYMYQYYDEFQLILTKSQGSRFEQSIDRFVEITEKHYQFLADHISNQVGSEKINECIVHWIAHMQINAFVHMLTHEPSEEAAHKHMETIIKFLISGWFAMFR